jgi:23S rRNA (adenine2503-C2)-methyltransferase
MTSLFDLPAPDVLARLATVAPPLNTQRSLRAAYRFESAPWIGGRLAEAASGWNASAPEVAARTEAADGTTKFLVRVAGGAAVECVLIPGVRGKVSRDRMSARNREDGKARIRRPTAAACVSSQVGCAAGCTFCASGLGGLGRNLTAGEIATQALLLRREAESRGLRLATVVFMGMGEPLHNVDHVVTAIRNLTHRHAGALPPAGVTVSTVGIVPGMRALAASHEPPHLAVSLHAPDDETRAKIVRSAPRLWSVEETLDAAAEYRERTGRHVTVSYVLLEGVNDSTEQARLLGERLRGRKFHVNVIPHNAVEGLPWRAPSADVTYAFWSLLRESGATIHIRKTRGSEGDAACGQLARRAAPTSARD